jgi:phytanoyl-CoA hydroxylase
MEFSLELRDQFKTNGFILIRKFLKQDELEQTEMCLETLIKEKVPSMPTEHVFYENKEDIKSIKQIQTLFSYDPFFEKMMFNSRFEQLASFLLDDQVVGKNMQYFNKPPLIGQPTPPHQDGYYFMLEPNEALTMWMPLEHVDQENGCVRYIKGSHLKGMRKHSKTQVLGFSQGMTDFGTEEDMKNEVYFDTEPGDLLVHHALTIHRADGNQSKTRSRKALGFIYYAKSAREDTKRKNEYQEKLKNEIIQQA